MRQKKLLLGFLITSNILIAGVTGKLVGTITDVSTGEPLIGVNVVLKGTALGAASDENGDFFILNIPAKKYTVSASYIGFKTTSVTDVRMNADRTTTVNFALEISAVEGEEVIVEAERPVIVRDQTATTTTIASFPSIIATQELVVPKSIPITFDIINPVSYYLFFFMIINKYG